MDCGRAWRLPLNHGVVLSWLCLAASAPALWGGDFLAGAGRLTWSPDSKWFAFNIPGRRELHLIGSTSDRMYVLRPVGDHDMDMSMVVGPAALTGAARTASVERVTQVIPVRGDMKLQLVGWDPASRLAAYRYGTDRIALFSIVSAEVDSQLAPGAGMSWMRDQLQVGFEFSTQTNLGARYRLLVKRADDTVVDTVDYDDRTEVSEIANLRFRDCSFLSPDQKFMLYPRHRQGTWQLVRQSVGAAANKPAVPLLTGQTSTPYEWKLSPDSTVLAFNDRARLTMGTIDDWANARSVPIPTTGITMEWSPRGTHLAYQSQQKLLVWPCGGGDPFAVSEVCAPRFWGWRDASLLFGHAKSSVADIYRVGLDHPQQVDQVSQAPHWGAAPYAIAIAPDGKTVACLVSTLDSSGTSAWQVWQNSLDNQNQWQMLATFREDTTQSR